MSKKIVAIVGSYRKSGTIHAAVDALLQAAAAQGAQCSKIDLLDKRVEFCDNCRACAQKPGVSRGNCPIRDDMESILSQIDAADGLVLAAPVNCYNLTAIFRRFMERLVCYAYWPWGAKYGPKMRLAVPSKKAVLIASSACPAFFISLSTGAPRALKVTAQTLGAKVVGKLWMGMSAVDQKQALDAACLKKARELGTRLAQ